MTKLSETIEGYKKKIERYDDVLRIERHLFSDDTQRLSASFRIAVEDIKLLVKLLEENNNEIK